jgi:tRNA (cytidine(34)-2'-O)-methyltransferase
MQNPNLKPHQFSVALLQPQIAPNTGNISRLCVATSTRLHLVRPMGFVLSDRNLKRSAMDYWDRLQLSIHDDNEAFFKAVDPNICWFFTSKSERSFWDVTFTDGDARQDPGKQSNAMRADPSSTLGEMFESVDCRWYRIVRSIAASAILTLR